MSKNLLAHLQITLPGFLLKSLPYICSTMNYIEMDELLSSII